MLRSCYDVVVIGAGIVGVCTALSLQRAGFKVTLIDRDAPGEATSFGNSGSFGTASVPPIAMPGTLAKVPKMLFDPLHALVLRWSYLPRSWRWFLHFALASRRLRVEALAEARHRLLAHTYEAFDPLLKEAGAEDLIPRGGRLEIFESEAAFAASQYAFELRRRHGGVPAGQVPAEALREAAAELVDLAQRRRAGGLLLPLVGGGECAALPAAAVGLGRLGHQHRAGAGWAARLQQAARQGQRCGSVGGQQQDRQPQQPAAATSVWGQRKHHIDPCAQQHHEHGHNNNNATPTYTQHTSHTSQVDYFIILSNYSNI